LRAVIVGLFFANFVVSGSLKDAYKADRRIWISAGGSGKRNAVRLIAPDRCCSPGGQLSDF
jgi:hypothetical protein